MFNNLQNQLNRAFHTLKGYGKINEINIIKAIKEIRNSLLNADVNLQVVKEFTDKVRKKAIGKKVISSLSPDKLIVKIVYDELVHLMGGKNTDINLSKDPTIILVAGLQGSGKTTFSAKLANFLKNKKHKNPILVAADIYRPAAIEQLKILGKQIKIPVFSIEENKNPLEIIEKSLDYINHNFYDVLIIDTAGRLSIDDFMMKEIKNIYNKICPNETLFVVDSMIGQDSINVAKAFNDILDYQGVVLTKLDGDTRGGVALSICSVVNKPIKFISNGEKIQDINIFYPERIANRILGMGDIVSLVEKAHEQFDKEETKNFYKKISKNSFNFNDFLKYIQQIKKMGNMKDLIEMIPGAKKILENTNLKENSFKKNEAIIYSMTAKEREFPKIIDISRKNRIAKGSATSIEEVNNLLKQFKKINKLMIQIKNSSSKDILKNAISHFKKKIF